MSVADDVLNGVKAAVVKPFEYSTDAARFAAANNGFVCIPTPTPTQAFKDLTGQ